MKRIFTFILLSIFAAAAFAQAPQKLSYQAVIRNTSDQLVTNTTVGMQISILQGSATGTVVYSETQTPTTNANGLVSIEIGGGTGFDAIDWSNGPYFIKTETDITGGTTYTISGTSELLSVPYALHAKTAESVVGGITETDPVFDLSAAATISATDITNWNNKLSTEVDGDVTNEIQILSISNDTIRLTNGGFIKLPAGFDGDYNSLINKPTIPVVPTNVSAFTNDAGYLTSFTEVDGSVTNEIQILSISNDTIRLTNGGYVKLPAGFDGQYSSLTGPPTNVSSFTNDAGYLTSFTEVDGDATNELQILSISNDTIRLTNGGYVKLPAGFDGQYSSLTGAPTNVSSFTNDAGYLTTFTEVDPEVGANTTNFLSKWNGTSLISSTVYDDGVNVGIGTATPTYKLDVSADAQINGVRVGLGAGNQAYNTVVGSYALMNNTTGFCNTALGYYSLFSNTTGKTNTAVGQHSLYANTIGTENTALGCQALTNNIDGDSNTALGLQSLWGNTSGSNNTGVGLNAMVYNTIGNNNVAVGMNTGYSSISGSNNVFLGYQAGYYETGSNKLYIANSSTSTPLIYGDFSTATLTVFSNLNINNKYTFPSVDGTNGQILSTNGSGVVGWNSLATVATSGSYSDLSGAPTNVSAFTNDAGYLTTFTEVDPEVGANTTNYISKWNGTSLISSTVYDDGTKVGIGTATPAYKLDVAADAQINGVRVGRGGGNQANNVVLGNGALPVNTNGGGNVAIGQDALNRNTTGGSNTAVGGYSMLSFETGFYNTAIGHGAMQTKTSGDYNTATGRNSLYSNINGVWNSIYGCNTLNRNSSGSYNTAFGGDAGYNNVSGSGNVFLGYQAGYNETGSNKLYIANSSTSTPLIYGDFSTGYIGLGTNTPTARLQIKPTADDLSLRIMSPASDARYISIYRGGNGGVINVAGDAMSNEPYLSLQIGGSEKMSIYNTGNVGIGTTIASTKLEVVGVITATGGNSTNWNTAYSWGDHAGLYRPVSWVPDWTDVTNKPSFALVATSGSYSDLSNTPTNVSSFINDAGYLTSFTEVDGDVTNEIEMPDDANAGDMAYFDGSAWVKIPKGNDNQILTLQAGIPTWQNQFALPTATSTVATNVTATTATLNGIVSANGLSTVVTFEYGPTTSYGTTVTATQSPVTGAASTSVSVDISGLVDGTTYYFRIKAENAIGIVYSTEMSFQFLSVGESYQGGIVAYILQAGDPGYDASIQHGIIAAPSDQSTNAQWGCINTLLCSEITTEGMPIGKGNQNTMEIINGCSTSGIAARLCGDLVLGGYDDWFLPSYNELMQLYLNKSIIGGLSNAEYWSSSEGTSWYAYTLNFSDGVFGYPNKDYGHYVRAVRSF